MGEKGSVKPDNMKVHRDDQFVTWLEGRIRNAKAGAERMALLAVTGPRDQRQNNELLCKKENDKKETYQEVLDMFNHLYP